MSGDFEDFRAEIEEAISNLGEIEQAMGDREAGIGDEHAAAVAEPPVELQFAAIARGLRASLMVADSALGECQKALPFSPLRPILKPGESRVVWCCNHDPPHCGE